MDQKLVSVNITTYNRAHLLERCLNSILSQTYRNLEIVIVDDASSDNTCQIISEYQEKDDRIKYICHEENKGNAHARNTALATCSGYYVAFMDDDDEWIAEDKLKKQVDIFEKGSDKLGLVCTSVVLVDQQGNKKTKTVTEPDNLKAHILARNGIIYSPTVMTKRNIMEKVAGFDPNFIRGVDSDFYRKCIVKYGYTVHFMSEPTVAIHEYGDDRMTPVDTVESILKDIKVTELALKKYDRYFKTYPQSKIFRKKKLLKRYLIIFIHHRRFDQISNFIKMIFL